jgi:hypothetical protein
VSGLVDATGCLTEAGLAVLGSAAPGAAPPELAQHVASCARCQERWLKSEPTVSGKPRPTAETSARRRWGALGIVVFMLLFALAALVATLRYVAG